MTAVRTGTPPLTLPASVRLSRLLLRSSALKLLLPAQRVLVQAHRAASPARRWAPPLVLHRPEGGYTDEAEAILRHGQPLAF